MIVFSVNDRHGDGCCFPSEEFDEMIEHVKTTLDGLNAGDKLTIELAEMTQEEFDALPEFEGYNHE